MSWTPAIGARALAQRLGEQATRDMLDELLGDAVARDELTIPPWSDILLDIGDGHAARLLQDEAGMALAYWPRVWSARALGYLGGDLAVQSLLAGLEDEHWRVRMISLQGLGRLKAPATAQRLTAWATPTSGYGELRSSL